MTTLAWGRRVTPMFRACARLISGELGFDPTDLMTCMAFETGRTFSADVRNGAGSGAIGLIQFMPSTAAALGYSVEDLAAMSAEEQLQVVRLYFRPWKGRLKNLGDLYMAILWPGAVGKPDSHVLFDRADPRHPKRYVQNRGLDFNKDGKVTRGEACARLVAMRAEGLLPANVWAD